MYKMEWVLRYLKKGCFLQEESRSALETQEGHGSFYWQEPSWQHPKEWYPSVWFTWQLNPLYRDECSSCHISASNIQIIEPPKHLSTSLAPSAICLCRECHNTAQAASVSMLPGSYAFLGKLITWYLVYISDSSALCCMTQHS